MSGDNLRLFVVLFLIIPLYAAPALEPLYLFPSEEKLVQVNYWSGVEGIDEFWSSPEFDDSDWGVVEGFGLWNYYFNQKEGVRTYRREIVIVEQLLESKRIAIFVPAAISAYRVYWDGDLVGESGKIGTSYDTEVSGKTAQFFTVFPKNSTPGKHLLVFELSNYHSTSGAIEAPLKVGVLSTGINALFRSVALGLFLAGIFLITAIFHTFLFSTRETRTPHAIFSLFSLACAGHIIVSNLPLIIPVNNSHIFALAVVGDIFWFGMLAYLPIFLLYHFNTGKRRLGATLIIVSTLLVVALPRLATYNIVPVELLGVLDGANRFYAYLSIIIALLINIKAVRLKRVGSRTTLLGLAAFFGGVVLTTTLGVTNGWSVGLAALNIFITVTIAKQMSEQRQLFHNGELKTSRLELELLKKHIQPHFLLNSLNSILAWVEEEPQVATRLITELSKELRILMFSAGERVVALSQEIKLCKIHLEVMSLRQDKKFELEIVGDTSGVNIPPLILHTIVENGISHGFRREESGLFRLNCSRDNDRTVLLLENSGDSTKHVNSSSTGTGGRYIRSRLEEVFGGAWIYSSEPSEFGWETKIEFWSEE
jgi:hypothetical protein